MFGRVTAFTSIALCVVLLSSVRAEPATQPSKVLVNVDKSGLAILGRDPVAYFTDNKAVAGDASITSERNGATYRFSSVEHKTMFEKANAWNDHSPKAFLTWMPGDPQGLAWHARPMNLL